MNILVRWYSRFSKATSFLQSPFLLVVRLYWGWQFAVSGWEKMHNVPRFTTYFASLNIPFPAASAHFVAGVEFFGGLLLILGLASRLAGLILAVQYARCLLDSRSPGTPLLFLRSGQVHLSRRNHLSHGRSCDFDLRPWTVLSRCSAGLAPEESVTGSECPEAAEPRDERHMITAILGGEANLYHELIQPYERSVFVMALSFLHNEADAEDVAQEAFLKAFRNLANFRGEAKFGTWLISITLNEARSRIRRGQIVPMISLDEDPSELGQISPALLRDWREIPSQTLERQEVRMMLREAVAALPQNYREVFLLRDVEELSTSEAAELLQISVASLKVRLHRARMMLQKNLAPRLKGLNPKRRWFLWS